MDRETRDAMRKQMEISPARRWLLRGLVFGLTGLAAWALSMDYHEAAALVALGIASRGLES